MAVKITVKQTVYGQGEVLADAVKMAKSRKPAFRASVSVTGQGAGDTVEQSVFYALDNLNLLLTAPETPDKPVRHFQNAEDLEIDRLEREYAAK